MKYKYVPTTKKILVFQLAFRTYLGIFPQVNNWNAAGDEFSLIFDNNPLIEFVELPDHCSHLKYSNILVGILRGACEMVSDWIFQLLILRCGGLFFFSTEKFCVPLKLLSLLLRYKWK